MKNVFLIFICLFASMSGHAEVLRLSEPVARDADTETFGAVLNETLQKVSLTELAERPEDHLNKPFHLKTRIAKVCQRKGCFFIAQQNEHVLRVSFRDYGFFIPTDSSDKMVEIAGELVEKELSPEQAAHLQSDLGDDEKRVRSGKVYEIVADSVKIPLS